MKSVCLILIGLSLTPVTSFGSSNESYSIPPSVIHEDALQINLYSRNSEKFEGFKTRIRYSCSQDFLENSYGHSSGNPNNFRSVGCRLSDEKPDGNLKFNKDGMLQIPARDHKISAVLSEYLRSEEHEVLKEVFIVAPDGSELRVARGSVRRNVDGEFTRPSELVNSTRLPLIDTVLEWTGNLNRNDVHTIAVQLLKTNPVKFTFTEPDQAGYSSLRMNLFSKLGFNFNLVSEPFYAMRFKGPLLIKRNFATKTIQLPAIWFASSQATDFEKMVAEVWLFKDNSGRAENSRTEYFMNDDFRMHEVDCLRGGRYKADAVNSKCISFDYLNSGSVRVIPYIL